MEKPSTRIFSTHGAPVPSNQVPDPETPRITLAGSRNSSSATQPHPVCSPNTLYFGSVDANSFLQQQPPQEQNFPNFPSVYAVWHGGINHSHNNRRDDDLPTPAISFYQPSIETDQATRSLAGTLNPSDNDNLSASYGSYVYQQALLSTNSTPTLLHQSFDALPCYPATPIEFEPVSVPNYFALPQYTQESPGHYQSPPELTAQPHVERRVEPEKTRRKRGRPPAYPDTVESRPTTLTERNSSSRLSFDIGQPMRCKQKSETEASTRTTDLKPNLQARNRAAANRYRAKTQAAVAQLEAQEREVSSKRQSLLIRASELRDEVFQLKNEVFRHANCGCPRIEGYLEMAAQQGFGKQSMLST